MNYIKNIERVAIIWIGTPVGTDPRLVFGSLSIKKRDSFNECESFVITPVEFQKINKVTDPL